MNSEASAERAPRPRRPSYFPQKEEATPEYERRYGDFTTIDWVRDAKKERAHQHGLVRRRSGSWRSWILQLYDSCQPILVILLVGACIGLTATIINITTEWLSDLKVGYCSTGWWLNQKFCCWEMEDELGTCNDWYEWSYAIFSTRDLYLLNWIFFVLFAVLLSGTAGILVRYYAQYAAGSGISEIKTILSGFVIQGYLGGWTWLIKSFGLSLSVGSGLSVGKEGPSVHVACCAGNVVTRLFSKYRYSKARKREILTAASAAGVAVAFGSPIGGVLFALEEMTGEFSMQAMWRSFACALVATLTIQAANPFRTGKLVMFQVTYERNWHFFEIIWFILLGICGGLYGALLIRWNLMVNRFRKSHLAQRGIQEAIILASVTAIIGYHNIFTSLDMTELMSILFKECEEGDFYGMCQNSQASKIVALLLQATIFRFIFTVLSFGCKVPAGVFVPSMAIGACFGRMLGVALQVLHRHNPDSLLFSGCTADVQCITPGTYAFLGAAATLGGATKMTVSVVVIMFELTGALRYILPTMIVVLVTKAVGDLFYEGGIADQLIHLNGLPFLDKEDHSFGIPVSSVMIKDLTVIPSTPGSLRLEELEEILRKTTYKGFPVVNNRGEKYVEGYVMRRDIMYVLDGARQDADIHPRTQCVFADIGEGAGPGYEEDGETYIYFSGIVDRTPITAQSGLPFETAMDYFKLLGPRVILVEEQGRLRGQLTRKDAVKATHRVLMHASSPLRRLSDPESRSFSPPANQPFHSPLATRHHHYHHQSPPVPMDELSLAQNRSNPEHFVEDEDDEEESIVREGW